MEIHNGKLLSHKEINPNGIKIQFNESTNKIMPMQLKDMIARQGDDKGDIVFVADTMNNAIGLEGKDLVLSAAASIYLENHSDHTQIYNITNRVCFGLSHGGTNCVDSVDQIELESGGWTWPMLVPEVTVNYNQGGAYPYYLDTKVQREGEKNACYSAAHAEINIF